MSISRRNFLGTMMFGAPLVHTNARAALLKSAGGYFESNASEKDAPLVTNYSASGRALITEGRTLLVAIKFPFAVTVVSASFPVEIEPESAEGGRLTEPQPLSFYGARDNRTFRTILSAPLDSVNGTHTLRLSARAENGGASQWSFPYRIQPGVYPNKALTLDENFSSPTPEIAARMKNDFQTMLAIYKGRSARQWSAPFVEPVPGPDRNNFGDKRTVNRTKRYHHRGLDYRAAMRTPVRAINDGTVVLSTEQWTPGQTICINHGGGIFSKYLHLSQRRVGLGDKVSRRQVIALSGNTGGQKPPPHLHLDLVINGSHVDPRDFMNTAAQLVALEARD